jgi:hypothetical protein
MSVFEHCTFDGGVVDVDGNDYTDCQFTGCTIRYSGGGPIKMDSCKFEDCQFALDGAAANTISYLTGLHQGLGETGRDLVERLFEQIRGAGDGQPE